MAHTPQGGDWTNPEISRFLKREAVFMEHGMDAHEAERLAQTMLYRDRSDDDDRRLCFECRHYSPPRCRSGHALNPLVLQRCPGFALKSSSPHAHQ